MLTIDDESDRREREIRRAAAMLGDTYVYPFVVPSREEERDHHAGLTVRVWLAGQVASSIAIRRRELYPGSEDFLNRGDYASRVMDLTEALLLELARRGQP